MTVPKAAQSASKPVTTGVFEATLGPNGDVAHVPGHVLTMKEASEFRKKGYNVVVCGPNVQTNRDRAKAIEVNAYGNVVHHCPTATAGANALWHFQPDPRGRSKGHTFYESTGRSAQ